MVSTIGRRVAGSVAGVLIGSADLGSANLRSSERLDAQQGTNRLERARRWVAAMRSAASAYGLRPRVSLTEVGDIDHSFSAFYERGTLLDHVDRSLFGRRRARAGSAAVSGGASSERAVTETGGAGARL